MNPALLLGAFAVLASCTLTWFATVSVMVHNREKADRARADRARARFDAWPGRGDWRYPQPSEAHPPLPGTWEAPPNEGDGPAIPASEWPKTAGAYDG